MNISRPDFYKNLNTSSEPVQITENDLFDEIMALYNIVSDDYISVVKEPFTDRFIVTFESSEKAKGVYDLIKGKETTIYGRVIQLLCWYNDSTDVIISFHTVKK